MKKVITLILSVTSLMNVHAQQSGLEAGVHTAFTLGDIKNSSTIDVGADVAYYIPINDKIRLGIATGYHHIFREDISVPNIFEGGTIDVEFEDVGIFPIAASVKIKASKAFFVGADLGYAFLTNKEFENGLYMQGKVGYFNSAIDLYLFYKNISSKHDEYLAEGYYEQSNYSIGSAGIGIMYKF